MQSDVDNMKYLSMMLNNIWEFYILRIVKLDLLN